MPNGNINNNINIEIENPVTALELAKLLPLHMKYKRPVMIWGDSGIGKTELIHQVGRMISYRVLVLQANIRDAVDFRGVPFPNAETRTTEWFHPGTPPS